MQTDHEAGQVSIFGPDLWYGKMCREPSPAESGRARTSASSWKRSSELSAVPFMSLDLTPGHGNLLGESYWELISPYPASTEAQALLRELGEKSGVTLRIYCRQVSPGEEDRIIDNANKKNKLDGSDPNKLRQKKEKVRFR